MGELLKGTKICPNLDPPRPPRPPWPPLAPQGYGLGGYRPIPPLDPPMGGYTRPKQLKSVVFEVYGG